MGSPTDGSGLLRCTLYNGTHSFAKLKRTYDRETGNYKSVGHNPDAVVNACEELRIVPADIWNDVQIKLAGLKEIIPHECRRPSYLFSGLIRCGLCGSSYTMNSGKYECQGRVRGICENRRRVANGVIEEVVLSGIVSNVLADDLCDEFLAEYTSERERAVGEAESRKDAASARMKEIDRELRELLKHVKSGTNAFAVEIINEELSKLGTERNSLAIGSGSYSSELQSLDRADVAERIRNMLTELPRAIHGEHRDAHRARDILRSFISEITICPVDDPGGRIDKRGAGPVSVTVTGSLVDLVEASLLDRTVPASGGPWRGRYSTNSTFRFTIAIQPCGAPLSAAGWINRDKKITALQWSVRDIIASSPVPISTREIAHSVFEQKIGKASSVNNSVGGVRKALHTLLKRELVEYCLGKGAQRYRLVSDSESRADSGRARQ